MIDIELKTVHYRIRGVPKARTRAFFHIDGVYAGALTGNDDAIDVLIMMLTMHEGVKVEDKRAPRQD